MLKVDTCRHIATQQIQLVAMEICVLIVIRTWYWCGNKTWKSKFIWNSIFSFKFKTSEVKENNNHDNCMYRLQVRLGIYVNRSYLWGCAIVFIKFMVLLQFSESLVIVAVPNGHHLGIPLVVFLHDPCKLFFFISLLGFQQGTSRQVSLVSFCYEISTKNNNVINVHALCKDVFYPPRHPQVRHKWQVPVYVTPSNIPHMNTVCSLTY